MEKINLSIAIPYHGDRLQWTMQTILNIHNNNFVKEIVITVDPSDFDVKKLYKATKNYKKVKIFENESRLFVFRNKIKAVTLCSSEWVALIDSDNIIGAVYLGPILNKILDKKVIYSPECGFPALNYQKFTGKDIGIREAISLIGDKEFDMLINTMNYVFHRKTWLSALCETINQDYDPVTADSAWINYNCMKNGIVLRVVKGSTYKHTVHKQSTYILYQKEGSDNYSKICQMMKGLINEDMGCPGEIQTREPSYLSNASNWTSTGRSSGDVVQEERKQDTNRFSLLTD